MNTLQQVANSVLEENEDEHSVKSDISSGYSDVSSPIETQQPLAPEPKADPPKDQFKLSDQQEENLKLFVNSARNSLKYPVEEAFRVRFNNEIKMILYLLTGLVVCRLFFSSYTDTKKERFRANLALLKEELALLPKPETPKVCFPNDFSQGNHTVQCNKGGIIKQLVLYKMQTMTRFTVLCCEKHMAEVEGMNPSFSKYTKGKHGNPSTWVFTFSQF